MLWSVYNVLKRLSFWCTVFAFGIFLFNYLGYDDKSILLYITSPPFWILGNYSSFLGRFLPDGSLLIIYVFNFLFWFLLGMLLDGIINRNIRHTLIRNLPKITTIIVLITVSCISFYIYQNSERVMNHILSHPYNYSSKNIQYAVNYTAQKKYGLKYTDKMTKIVQETRDREVYSSTIYALGIIGTPEAIIAITSNYNRIGDYYIEDSSLEQNKNTILTMLEINNSREVIESGIHVASIVRFESFTPSLEKIVQDSTNIDTVLRTKAALALENIKENPRISNPKWDED